jgi:hypothetical protein
MSTEMTNPMNEGDAVGAETIGEVVGNKVGEEVMNMFSMIESVNPSSSVKLATAVSGFMVLDASEVSMVADITT